MGGFRDACVPAKELVTRGGGALGGGGVESDRGEAEEGDGRVELGGGS